MKPRSPVERRELQSLFERGKWSKARGKEERRCWEETALPMGPSGDVVDRWRRRPDRTLIGISCILYGRFCNEDKMVSYTTRSQKIPRWQSRWEEVWRPNFL